VVDVAKARGEFVDAGGARLTIGELGRTWLASQTHLKPSTLRVVEMAWRVHVEPELGARSIGGVKHSQVQTWVSNLSRIKSATSVLRAHGILAAVLDVAVKDRQLMQNPARGVTLPRKSKKPHVYLTHDQVWELARASGENAAIVLLLAYTALRWGEEAPALRLKHLNTLRRRLNITENAVTYGPVAFVGTPKNHGARSVPYPRFLSEPIALVCAGKQPGDLVLGDGLVHLRRLNTSQNLNVVVYPGAGGGRPRADDSPRLRHTAASLAVSAGANVKAVKRMLGHASAAMTLDTYADVFDDDLDSVSDALDAAVAKSDVGKVWAEAQKPQKSHKKATPPTPTNFRINPGK